MCKKQVQSGGADQTLLALQEAAAAMMAECAAVVAKLREGR